MPRSLEDRYAAQMVNSLESLSAQQAIDAGFTDERVTYDMKAGEQSFVEPEAVTNPAAYEEARVRARDYVRSILLNFDWKV